MYVLIIITIVLLILKLLGLIVISWLTAFAPLLIGGLIYFLIMIIYMIFIGNKLK